MAALLVALMAALDPGSFIGKTLKSDELGLYH